MTPPTTPAEVLEAVCHYAAKRIDECRRVEQKFGVGDLSTRGAQMPQTTIEAWTERQTLEAVLRIVNGGHILEPVGCTTP